MTEFSRYLQKSPQGLLSAFDLKVGGQNPDHFGDTVSPAIDVLDFYGAPNLEFALTTVAIGIGIATATLSLTVPNGKIWNVKGIGPSLALGAADVAFTAQARAIISNPSNTAGISPVGGSFIPTGVANRSIPAPTPGVPLLLPSGWIVRCEFVLSAIATQAATAILAVMRQEFDA